MSSDNRHIIQKLALEVRCPDAQTGTLLYDQLSDTLQSRILPRLEKVFNRMGDVRLEKLELRLDTLPSDNWESTFESKVLKACEIALLQQIKNQDPASLNSTGEGPSRQEVDVFEAYLFFLKTGRLPWWAEHRGLETIEQELGKRNALEAEKKLTVLLRLFASQSQTLLRFVRQAPDNFLVRFWNFIKPKDGPARPSVLKKISKLIAAYFSRVQADSICTEAAFSAAMACHSRPDISFQTAVLEAVLQRFDSLRFDLPDLVNNLKKLLEQEKSRQPGQPESPKSVSGSGKDKFENRKNEQEAEGLLKQANAKSAVSPPETADTPDGAFFVVNAGLVLLHPFLPQFFETLGLLEGDDFIDDIAREQAVQSLHFLATGNRECPETELVLPKILCNMPAEFPVARRFEPDAALLSEAESLLTTAIQHWAVLKNTSPDGLREGFLNRDGKLESRDDGSLKLTVERQIQDVLLEQLPWSFGIVRLPWMEQMLFVEW